MRRLSFSGPEVLDRVMLRRPHRWQTTGSPGESGDEAIGDDTKARAVTIRPSDEHCAFQTTDEHACFLTRRARKEHKSFASPDETRAFPNGRAEILEIGGGSVGRMVFEPGWRWSNDVRPIAGTASCDAPHLQYHVSGQLGILMDDGTEIVAGPGDITSLPSGHDAWVIGDEPAVTIDWFGASAYALGD